MGKILLFSLSVIAGVSAVCLSPESGGTYSIPGFNDVGSTLSLSGIINPRPNTNRTSIQLHDGAPHAANGADLQFLMELRFPEGLIVRNTFADNIWYTEVRDVGIPAQIGGVCEFTIRNVEQGIEAYTFALEVDINGTSLSTYPHIAPGGYVKVSAFGLDNTCATLLPGCGVCENGGTCVSRESGAFCACPDTHIGRHCEYLFTEYLHLLTEIRCEDIGNAHICQWYLV